MENNKVKKVINADMLKWIALITMFIDHIGAGILEIRYPQLYDVDIIIRGIGRIAFPIFCFQIVEGFEHTRSKKKYALNLLIFAIISEAPFDVLFRGKIDFAYQNVYFTLLIGLLAIFVLSRINLRNAFCDTALRIVVTIAFPVVAELIKTDYGMWGVMLIEIIYLCKNRGRLIQCIICSLFLCTNPVEIPGIIAFVLIYFYNGERKNKINKYVFYSLYPIHLSLYIGIRYLLKVNGI